MKFCEVVSPKKEIRFLNLASYQELGCVREPSCLGLYLEGNHVQIALLLATPTSCHTGFHRQQVLQTTA